MQGEHLGRRRRVPHVWRRTEEGSTERAHERALRPPANRVDDEPDGRRSSLKKVGLTDGRVSEVDVGTNEALTAISATPDGHVWLSTVGGGLLHFAP